ncbi:MAG TPA: ATP phosphoribosyltransferase [Spirochaetota bacterium]|nr:ATP phosphoribosyltransferase [Spirochaetota bacterium]HOM37745.1 ATP phosphoribosyltransferase [Spirochaetota bacterium]HPQ49378.1 ATP phosphoribosyltransferase [Spirochaetota bacterium]
MIELDDRILFAVPKKGRLKDPTLSYLTKIGLSFHKNERLDIALCNNTPIALIFLPATDIPLYVANGKVAYGITGEDIISEHKLENRIEIVTKLGFGKCKVALAGPKNIDYSSFNYENVKIATSFPNITKKFLEKKGIKNYTINEISGSVEISPALSVSDLVVDIVETGSTLKEAGLIIIENIMNTEAIFISKKNLDNNENEWKEKLKERFNSVITAEKYLIIDYNIHKNNLEKAEKITPGFNSPTILPLVDKEWFAIRAVIKSEEKYKIIEELKKIGAQAIIISKMDYFVQ